MNDGGDDAETLSDNMAEVKHSLSAFFMNRPNVADQAERIAAIFNTRLRPNQMADYVQRPGADTEAGVIIDVFPLGSELHRDNDDLNFAFLIAPGEATLFAVRQEDGTISFHGSTDSVFTPGPPFPSHSIAYANNTLNVRDVEFPIVPVEADGGDNPVAAFVDLCA